MAHPSIAVQSLQLNVISHTNIHEQLSVIKVTHVLFLLTLRDWCVRLHFSNVLVAIASLLIEERKFI